jgi:hypothetical protein
VYRVHSIVNDAYKYIAWLIILLLLGLPIVFNIQSRNIMDRELRLALADQNPELTQVSGIIIIITGSPHHY